MLFSEREIDALRLLCWCQYIGMDDMRKLLTETEQCNLMLLGLMRQHKKSTAFILTNQGRSFLSEALDNAIPELAQSYHKDAIQRRLRLAGLILTAYRGHIDPFTTTVEELLHSPSLFLSAVTRSRGVNPWGSTRIAAIAHLGDLLCAAHYVCPGIGKLALTDELNAFTNQTARFRDARRAFLFAGESYSDILAELEASEPRTDTKLISYGAAYQCLQFPVHLLSCDDTGAVQLQIMSVPDYRRKLTRAALKGLYQSAENPAWDAFFQGMPFVMAADMDLRRLDDAISIARQEGYPQIAVAALEGQAEAVLFSRYRDTGKARVFILTNEAVSEVTGRPPVPYTPPRTQFLTAEGDVIDAPSFKAPGRAGR
ncbi:hypothetical protein [uncultured Oscillibacter sp.]|uniref:hypothetical protein n=1 Tax=uncultured Oscillibacter sp. TaxID=876091 RepID=UPI002609AC12|nr:hypothetical protein [uncultured Oscillibacter sp.]